MQARSSDVTIVGGGGSGLAAACALRAAGLSVVVLERRVDGGDAHRVEFLRPRAVELLRGWGVSFEGRGACEIREVAVEHNKRRLAHTTFDDGLCLPSHRLEAALRETAVRCGVDIRTGWTLQVPLCGADGRLTGVSAVSSSDGSAFNARLVLGADGRASSLRTALGIRLKAQENTSALLSVEAELPAGPSLQRTDRIVSTLSAAGGGTVFPLGERRVRVFVAVARGDGERLLRLSPEELLTELVPHGVLGLGAIINPASVRVDEATDTHHALNYATRGAVLIGDAVHAAPFPSGESLQMALLDVEALARLVGPAVSREPKALDKAIARWELERWPDNEARLARARTAVGWLAPLTAARRFRARGLLGSFALSSLTRVA